MVAVGWVVLCLCCLAIGFRLRFGLLTVVLLGVVLVLGGLVGFPVSFLGTGLGLLLIVLIYFTSFVGVLLCDAVLV